MDEEGTQYVFLKYIGNESLVESGIEYEFSSAKSAILVLRYLMNKLQLPISDTENLYFSDHFEDYELENYGESGAVYCWDNYVEDQQLRVYMTDVELYDLTAKLARRLDNPEIPALLEALQKRFAPERWALRDKENTYLSFVGSGQFRASEVLHEDVTCSEKKFLYYTKRFIEKLQCPTDEYHGILFPNAFDDYEKLEYHSSGVIIWDCWDPVECYHIHLTDQEFYQAVARFSAKYTSSAAQQALAELKAVFAPNAD